MVSKEKGMIERKDGGAWSNAVWEGRGTQRAVQEETRSKERRERRQLQGARMRRRVNTTRPSLCLMHSAGALDQSQVEKLMLAAPLLLPGNCSCPQSGKVQELLSRALDLPLSHNNMSL
jgi:hypothetical protein